MMMGREVMIKDLQPETWYWYTHYTESDVFYPIFIQNKVYALIDGEGVLISRLEGLTFYKAIMPMENDNA
jgi:hypothetical protein